MFLLNVILLFWMIVLTFFLFWVFKKMVLDAFFIKRRLLAQQKIKDLFVIRNSVLSKLKGQDLENIEGL
jgi:hypothetical protein